MIIYYNELVEVLRTENIVKLKSIKPYNPGFKYAVLANNKSEIVFKKRITSKSKIWDQSYDKLFDVDREWKGDDNYGKNNS